MRLRLVLGVAYKSGAFKKSVYWFYDKDCSHLLLDVVKFPNPIYGDENAKYFVQGHVEVLHNNVWGTICDDSLDASAPNGNNVASVLCRMQGYEGGIYSGSFKQSTAHKSSKIWLTQAVCKGTEKNIGECALGRGWGSSGCQHSEDIGIRCYMWRCEHIFFISESPEPKIVTLKKYTKLSTMKIEKSLKYKNGKTMENLQT